MISKIKFTRHTQLVRRYVMRYILYVNFGKWRAKAKRFLKPDSKRNIIIWQAKMIESTSWQLQAHLRLVEVCESVRN